MCEVLVDTIDFKGLIGSLQQLEHLRSRLNGSIGFLIVPTSTKVIIPAIFGFNFIDLSLKILRCKWNEITHHHNKASQRVV